MKIGFKKIGIFELAIFALFFIICMGVVLGFGTGSNIAHAQQTCVDGYVKDAFGNCVDPSLIITSPGAGQQTCAFGKDASGNCVSDQSFATPKGEPASVPGVNSNAQQTQESFIESFRQSTGFFGVVGVFVGKLLSMITWFVEFAINLSRDILDLQAVHTGWAVMLSLANLGFILALIVMAFATILHIDSYGMNKALVRLIIAALLVNFSMVIAGSLLDLSNIISISLLEKINAGNIGDAFGNALGPQKFLQPNDNSTSTFNLSDWNPLNWPEKIIKVMLSLIFVVVFTFLMILVLFTLFIMFMIRNVYLIFLLIVSPIAWLLWIFPSTKKHWTKWWDKFIKWLVFGPVALFFVILAITTMQTPGINGAELNSLNAAGGNSAAQAFQQGLNFNDGITSHIVKLILFIGLIVGGLMAANSFGIASGKIGIDVATKTGNNIKGWSKRKGLRTLNYPFAPGKTPGKITSKIPGYAALQNWRTKMNQTKVGQSDWAKTYRGKDEHDGLIKGVWNGVKDGSGLFDGKKAQKAKKEKNAKELIATQKTLNDLKSAFITRLDKLIMHLNPSEQKRLQLLLLKDENKLKGDKQKGIKVDGKIELDELEELIKKIKPEDKGSFDKLYERYGGIGDKIAATEDKIADRIKDIGEFSGASEEKKEEKKEKKEEPKK